MKTFRIGGVHPAENKLSAAEPIKVAELPKVAVFPMGQHIGAPALPCVHAYLKEINTNKMSLSGRGVVREFLGSKLYGLPYEQVVAVALDSKDGFIALEKIAKGDGSSVKIEVREIVDFALKHNAVNIVLAHNHPSGQTSPSQADVDLTAEVAYTLGTIGVNLEDHLIFCGSKFYSFADSGRLSKIAAVNQTLCTTQ